MKTLPNKFVIKIHSQEHSKVVQTRLFELGFRWHGYFGQKFASEPVNFYKEAAAILASAKTNELEYSPFDWYQKNFPDYKVFTTDDLFSIEKEVVVKVKLNSDYEAIVSKAGIVVGCQTFPLEIVEKLVAAKKSVLKSEE